MHQEIYISTETAVELFRSLPPIDYERFRADLDAAADQAPTLLPERRRIDDKCGNATGGN